VDSSPAFERPLTIGAAKADNVHAESPARKLKWMEAVYAAKALSGARPARQRCNANEFTIRA
jgi:hypothetical protein